jgi:hypothetical protein
MDHFWKIEADEPGVFRGQCTEYCGLSHANMRMIVRALEPADYDEWLENQLEPDEPAAGSLAAAGKDQFSALCAQCHVVGPVRERQGRPRVGPAGGGRRPRPHPLHDPGHLRRLDLQPVHAPGPRRKTIPTGNARDVAEPGDPGEALFGGESPT